MDEYCTYVNASDKCKYKCKQNNLCGIHLKMKTCPICFEPINAKTKYVLPNAVTHSTKTLQINVVIIKHAQHADAI